MSQFNFEVTKNGTLEPLTEKGLQLIVNPTERVEYVGQCLTYDTAPYDAQLQTYDLSSYGLTALEEEYLKFLHGL
jgi:hypothetical protein